MHNYVSISATLIYTCSGARLCTDCGGSDIVHSRRVISNFLFSFSSFPLTALSFFSPPAFSPPFLFTDMASYQWEFSQTVQGSTFALIITVDTVNDILKVECTQGSGDINALWLDYAGGDGTTSLARGLSALSMNGTKIAWDDVAVLSGAGLGTAGTEKETFLVAGESLEQSLESLGFDDIEDWLEVTFGVRATSVNGGGSVKLVDTTAELVGPPNNPPDITGDDHAATIDETNEGLSAEGQLTVTDSDGDTLTPTVKSVVVTPTDGVSLPEGLTDEAFLAMLSLELDSTDLDTSDGIGLDWSFDSDDEAFDFLTKCPTNEQIVLVYTIEVSDGKGGTDTKDITITIKATNDGPTVNVPADVSDDLEGAVHELAPDAEGAGTATLTDSGSFAFFDLDINDEHTVEVTDFVVTDAPDDYEGGVLGTLTVEVDPGNAATGDGSGRINWTFEVDDSDIGFLREGETITQLYTVTITDHCGAEVTQEIEITITGKNENPVVNDDLIYVSNSGTSVELPASLLLFNDSDDGGQAGLVITSITGPLWDDDGDPNTQAVQSVIYDIDAGTFAFNSDAIGQDAGEEATLTYTVEDAEGGSATGTVTVRLVATSTLADTVPLSGAYTASYISLNNGGDNVTGEENVIEGSAQVDYLFGDNNNDLLNGGAGDDVLTGGTNNDKFKMIAPASNGIDVITDFRNGNDQIALFASGGGWNAGNTEAAVTGTPLDGADYVTVAAITGFAAAAKNNKVVELGEAVSNSGIAGLTSNAADNAYVLLFNSDTNRGELWWDGNWATDADRFKIATIENFDTLAQVTGSQANYFAEWL